MDLQEMLGKAQWLHVELTAIDKAFQDVNPKPGAKNAGLHAEFALADCLSELNEFIEYLEKYANE